MSERVDVAIVGGGHNALVAAAYLARAGMTVVVLERLGHAGGAAVSAEPFPGVRARFSRYSYLVSLLPDALVDDLGLRLELRPRPTASYTPTARDGTARGLLVEQEPGHATRQSFIEMTGSDRELDAWQQFQADAGEVAGAVAPTLLDPLPRADEVRARTGGPFWADLVDRPLGHMIEERFSDDLVRGVVATDGLIGTFASLRDPSLAQNRCFLYHAIGNGTGEWRVPVGGMGAVTGELERAATAAGAVVRTGHDVHTVDADESGARVSGRVGDGEFAVDCNWVLCGTAPHVSDRLRGGDPSATQRPTGSQLKLNLLVNRLPNLRSGVDPATAFAGTLHVGESYSQLDRAHAEADAGFLPSRQPGEVYCHTLTDPSILGAELAASGAHTLTYFGLHTPAALFAEDPAATRRDALTRALREIDQHLAEPLEGCLMHDAEGRPCIEAKSPLDIEDELAMPGGHIFHGDLSWPWLAPDEQPSGPAEAWGVATPDPRVLLCGSGARRGGAVSGIAGHNAAHAVLDFYR